MGRCVYSAQTDTQSTPNAFSRKLMLGKTSDGEFKMLRIKELDNDDVDHGRATSGPRARSGPRRPSIRPATLLGNNIAIRPAKPQPKTNLVSWAELRVA